MRIYLPAIIFFLLFTSCVKDKPVTQEAVQVNLSQAKKVYVINEGNFGTGNASISLYDPAANQVVENIYDAVNHSAVGDVAQSMTFANNRYYIVVNNSGKIIVCDKDFKKAGQINGLSSPRYFVAVSNQKAYVSDLKSNVISVIDLNENRKVSEIPCSGWTEQMQLIYNKVFVCNVRKKYVYVLNTFNDTKTDSVWVGANAYSLLLDKFDKLWVLASGDKTKGDLPRLSRINILNNQVEAYFDFTQTESPGNLCCNATKDTLYFLNNGIYKMPVNSGVLPAYSFVNAGTKNFYGLGVNPNTHQIYASDAVDYSQKSNIYIYNAVGALVTNFKAGVNANGFYFEQ